MTSPYPLDFVRANGYPLLRADFRTEPEDFYVREELGFDLEGCGEHIYVLIRKRGQNTQWLAGQLAHFAGIKTMDVGFCGLKDRHAVTEQWFSLYCPHVSELPWADFKIEGVDVLQISRHVRKLKRGVHRCNHFKITLRQLRQLETDEKHSRQVADDLQKRLHAVSAGFPNYFGEQRFGHAGANLTVFVERDVARRQKSNLQANIKTTNKRSSRRPHGMSISAARSYLFNRVLSQRVRDDTWQSVLPGDINDTEATGPLWGRGRIPVEDNTLAIEQQVLAGWQSWCDTLEHVGLSQERRFLLARPKNFSAQQWDDKLCLQFSLSRGQYATALLRELLHLETVGGRCRDIARQI